MKLIMYSRMNESNKVVYVDTKIHRMDSCAPRTLGPGTSVSLRSTEPNRYVYGALGVPVSN